MSDASSAAVALPLRRTYRDHLERFTAVYLLIALAIAFSLYLPDTFARFQTVQTLLATQAVAGILALAAVFPLVARDFDLSIGMTAGVTSLVAAQLSGPENWSTGATIFACLLIGTFIGLVNGVLVTGVRLDPFIATLAVATILEGLTVAIATETVIADPASKLVEWGNLQLFDEIPLPAIYLLVIAVIGWFLIDVTALGRYLRVVGASPRSAALLGLPVRRIRATAFVLAGLVAGAAGILNTMEVGSSSQGVGISLTLPAYAAAYVGAATIHPGRFNVPGTIVAVFLLGVGVTGMQLMGAPAWATLVFNGSALILAVAFAAYRSRRLVAA